MLLDETKSLFRMHDIHPRKSLGQNFCVDKKLLDRMIEYADLNKNDVVLEVGSGFGFLTCLLSDAAKHVIAVELDPKLPKILKNRLKDRENVEIIQGNILEVELPRFDKVIANPPYSISSPLIEYLLGKNFDLAVVTLQKEFAQRLTAQTGTADYGYLTVMITYKADVEVLELLPSETFYPPPIVESAVIRFRLRSPKFTVRDEAFFFKLAKHLFTQRNRRAGNPLESFLQKIGRMDRTEARRIAKILPLAEKRVCDMLPEDFGALSDKAYLIVHSKKFTFKGRSFYVFPQIYEPSDDTFLLAEHLDAGEHAKVLDMGTGCGLLGTLAAEKAGCVVVADINPYALECAGFNVTLNGMAEKVTPILSDLFSGFGPSDKFDLIIFNPPYLPIDERIRPSEWIERAWYGGSDGRMIIDAFLAEANRHVSKKGQIIMIQSSLSSPEKTMAALRKMEFSVETVAEKELFFEKLVAIRAKKN